MDHSGAAALPKGMAGEILAAAAAGVLVYAETGACVFANPKAAEIVGTTVANVLRQNFRELASWRQSGLLALADKTLATGEPQAGEFHVTSTFGKDLWMNGKFSVFARDGQRFLLLITGDYTQRKQAELAVAGAKNFLHEIIDAVADPIFVKDREHRIVLANDACCAFLRCRREELIGKTVRDMFPPAEAEPLWADEEQVFQSGQPVVREQTLSIAPGVRHQVMATKSLYRNEHGRQFLVGVVRDLTGAAAMAAALRESEGLYHSLVRELPCAIFRKDLAGRYVYVNARFCEVMGMTEPELLGHTPAELASRLPGHWHVFNRDGSVQQGSQLGQMGARNHEWIVQTGQSIFMEEQLTARNGAVKHLQVLKFPVRDKAGNIIGSQGIQFDVTPRVEAEQALRASESRFRSLFQNLPLGLAHCEVILQDGQAQDWIYLDVNDAFHRIIGRENFTGRRVSETIPNLRELNPEVFEYYGRVARTGQPVSYEYFAKAFNKWLAVSVFSLRPRHIVVVFEEITARRESEAELRKLFRAVEQSPVSIVITDQHGRIEYVNPKFTQVTGFSPAEAVGKSPRLLKPKPAVLDQSEVYKNLWAKILAGQEWHGELQNQRKNGELFWESASISPITDSAGNITHFLAVKEDITRQKKLEEEFRQMQKMEAFGNLAAGVAHDFNNILTAIMGYADMVKRSLPPAGSAHDGLKEIIRMSERAADLTRQLLLFSRRQSAQKRVLEIQETVDNMGKMLRRLIGEHITLHTQYHAGSLPVFADAGMLEQVVLNLVVNARDAMPSGGDLFIETHAVELAEATGRHSAGQYVQLTVRDTGNGIPPENLDRIFEPFFTTKEVGKGTGLGLATVFGIVEQHHGWIEVDSTVGAGTTFRIFLPRHEVKAVDSPDAKPGNRPVRGTETILLVEDEEAVRLLARSVLLRRGYRVIEADSPTAALALWRQHRADIALLFTDMVMPGRMNGLELSQVMLAEQPALRVIYTSGYSDEMFKDNSVLRDRPNFLQKPYLPETLCEIVRRTLDTSP
jgi:PAS domain S-box-containing protein